MDFLALKDLDVEGKRVLMRVDFNVPLDEHGNVTNDKRIRACLPTLNYLLERSAKLILMTHVGRPKGAVVGTLRTDGIALKLSSLLGRAVGKANDCVGEAVKRQADGLMPGQVLLLENLRFHPEEEVNDDGFAKQLASLAEVYVNDAFANCHRAHASVHAITRFLPSCAGLLVEKEVKALSAVLENPEKPFVAVLGGVKLETKLPILKRFLGAADKILLGGAMIFNFYKAKGLEIGKSVHDDEQIPVARQLLEGDSTGKIVLPADVVVASAAGAGSPAETVSYDRIPADKNGLDIGPATVAAFTKELSKARTVLWNGPMGVFEIADFAKGTEAIARTIAGLQDDVVQVVGGGDSAAAVEQLGLQDCFTLVSTGGGASLKFIEKGTLPGIEALKESASRHHAQNHTV